MGASEIATLAGGLRRGEAQADAAVSGGASVGVLDERIVAVGEERAARAELARRSVPDDEVEIVDAAGGAVTPGLIDSHTHLLFAGTRERELGMRQAGASYMEILAEGGGILSTVEATRAATDDELLAHGHRWLDVMLAHGVTAIEAKSGYGLDGNQERRLLRLYAQLARESPVAIVPTFLGAHAVPADYRRGVDGAAAYARSIVDEQLPAVARDGNARFCDVFCEPEVFPVSIARSILVAAGRLGLRARLHADELAPSGGAQLAAEIGAASADHLACVSDEGIAALADAADRGKAVVATLLPATTLNLMSTGYAPARRLIDAGAPIALATDFNPGTSPTPNLQLVMSLARIELGLSAPEALTATTVNAAHSLGLDDHGSLEPGKLANLVVWNVATHEQIPYWLGANLVRIVIVRGRVVHTAA